MLFKTIKTVRSKRYVQSPGMATDFMEYDLTKLDLLWHSGRESFAGRSRCCESISVPRRCNLAIPETQLDTWAKQGSITGSSTTYNHIKGTLEAGTTPYAGKTYRVFLQGSYGNDTNIYSESDVDIVISSNQRFSKTCHC